MDFCASTIVLGRPTLAQIPATPSSSKGRVHESRVAQTLRFEPENECGLDRGFTDYAWFSSLGADSIYLVTRMKDNAKSYQCRTAYFSRAIADS